MIRRPAIGLLALVFRRLAGLSSDNLVNDSEGRLSRLSDSRLEFLLGKIAERARLFGEVLMDALRLERRALVPWGIRYPTAKASRVEPHGPFLLAHQLAEPASRAHSDLDALSLELAVLCLASIRRDRRGLVVKVFHLIDGRGLSDVLAGCIVFCEGCRHGAPLQLSSTSRNDSRSASFTTSQRFHASHSISALTAASMQARSAFGSIASSSQHEPP